MRGGFASPGVGGEDLIQGGMGDDFVRLEGLGDGV